MLRFKKMLSPVGELTLVASDRGLRAVLWENDKPERVKLGQSVLDESHPVLMATEKQLREYFLGTRRSFDLILDFQGTEFQKNIWQALLKIPYGETRTYGQLANQVSSPKASRAVGAANGKNPISIIAACHRVIGASGALTGFAGGLKAKEFLLNFEKQN